MQLREMQKSNIRNFGQNIYTPYFLVKTYLFKKKSTFMNPATVQYTR